MNQLIDDDKHELSSPPNEYQSFQPTTSNHHNMYLNATSTISSPETGQFNEFSRPKVNGFSNSYNGTNITSPNGNIPSSDNVDESENDAEDEISANFDRDINDTNQRMFEIDTGFSLEEKIVSAVWVHEREPNKMSWSRIMKTFKMRFNKDPPSQHVLQDWELKLFKHGNVHVKKDNRVSKAKPSRARMNGKKS